MLAALGAVSRRLRLNSCCSLRGFCVDVKATRNVLRPESPARPMLLDKHHRFHDYLRISLTERCNLRCQYCMPEEGVDLTPGSELLSGAEVARLARLFVNEGVTKIRLTGGEPLLRRDLVDIVQDLDGLRPNGLKNIALTTNAITLSKKLPQLIDSGLNLLNISLDTLDPFRFELITRRRGHDRVLAAIKEAAAAPGLDRVKVNCVIIRGMNEDELVSFVELTKDLNIEVRFIEYMPFDGNRWNDAKMMPYIEMRSTLEERFDLRRCVDDVSNTSKTFAVPGFKGRVGFITSMSEHFCNSCNRLRITADGNLKVCLFGKNEVSLRDVMRKEGSDEDISAIVSSAVQRKYARHAECAVDSPDSSKTTNGLLSHIDEASNQPKMVDISAKAVSKRTALARTIVDLPVVVANAIGDNGELSTKKGPVFTTAIIAGSMAVKKTSDLIPFCHALPLESCKIEIRPKNNNRELVIECSVSVSHKTGVEMEALTGASVAALVVYDMCKALSHDIVIRSTQLVRKSGGRSGVIDRTHSLTE